MIKDDVSLKEIFFVTLKIGMITFGGGYAMLPYFYSEILVKRRWFNDDEFVDILTVSQSVPGAIAINAAFNIGMCKRGLLGGICAVLGMAIPAFLAVLFILIFILQVRDEAIVRKVINGIITGSAALILMSAVRLSAKVFSGGRIDNILLSIFAFTAIAVFDADIVWLLILGVVIGLVRHYYKTIKKRDETVKKEIN